MIFNVKFIGLTPVENTGQISFEGDREGAFGSFMDYLNETYGPNNFKVIDFSEAQEGETMEGLDVFPLPGNAPTSKVLN